MSPSAHKKSSSKSQDGEMHEYTCTWQLNENYMQTINNHNYITAIEINMQMSDLQKNKYDYMTCFYFLALK